MIAMAYIYGLRTRLYSEGPLVRRATNRKGHWSESAWSELYRLLALRCATAHQSYCHHAGTRRPSSSIVRRHRFLG